MKRTRSSKTRFFMGILTAAAATAMATAETEVQELSLSDLMSLSEAVGTLTRMDKNKVPVSVTTITEDDIRATPARNLLDLIEALVPGAMYTDHPEQARLGMRGMIVDRNYKFLLLVDGHLMNQKTHAGVVTEIQNWDMNDIKQVKVIRGPGSVTYGPGAVAGVVAITTKKGEDAPGFKVSTSSVVPYGSQGTTMEYGRVAGDWSMYGYVNATWTRGYEGAKGYVENGTTDLKTYTWGEVGTSDHASRTRYLPNNSLLGDFQRDVAYMPQMRAHFNLTMPHGFSAFARYTQGGTSTGAALSKIDSPDSSLVDSRTYMARQFVASVKNQTPITEAYTVSSKVEWGSQDFERYSGTVGNADNLQDPTNTTHNFAESDLTAQTLLNATFAEKYQIALGAEYVYSKVGAGWFDDVRAMKFGDAQNIISGSDSYLAFNDTVAKLPNGMVYGIPYSKAGSKQAVFVGDGISAGTFSLLSEANLAFDDYFTLLLSGRADKNDYSSWMISPRVAVVSSLTPKNIVKGIWQRSMRMNNLEQMYLEDRGGHVSDPEVLEGCELIYTALPTDNLTVNVSGYRNDVESVGWSTELTKTVLQGNMVVYGSEIDATWKNDRWTIVLSHASTLMDEFELAEGQTTSGVSYADLDYEVVMSSRSGQKDTVILGSTGGSINNWSEQITKANVRYKVLPSLQLGVSSRIFWGFPGYDDQLDAIANARPKTAGDTLFANQIKPIIDSFVAEIRSKDAFGTQIRLDVSADWELSKGVHLVGMVQNLAGIGENRRFDYISGLKAATPRVAWVEEPRTYYMKLSAAF
jgi:outer membrane receptor for ferrienterochelin and colicin